MLDRPDFIGVFLFVVRVMCRRPSGTYAAVLISFVGLWGLELGVPYLSDAMHETDHRFTVSGYVYSTQGTPAGDARVHVRDLRDKSVEAITTYTDGTGYYKAVLHLHNDNEGDSLEVRALDEKLGLDEAKTVRATFVPADLKTERQVGVNIGVVPETVTAPSGGGYWRYLIAGVLVGGAMAVFVWSRRRKGKVKTKRRGRKRG
jgi:hypothetical protein